MHTYIPFLLFVIGLILIIMGSDYFVDCCIYFAKLLGVSQVVIGATLVSVCTTLPEATVSTNSALAGLGDMALGNAFGSIAFNTGIILSLIIIVSKPVLFSNREFGTNGIFLLILVALIFGMVALCGGITFWCGILLLLVLLGYIFYNVHHAKSAGNDTKKLPFSGKEAGKNTAVLVVSVACIIVGAKLLVTNGEAIAHILGVPEMIIGLTMASIGTSLPELMTAITALSKKASGLSIGNIFGANILNIVMVTGLSSVIMPLHAGREWLYFHLPVIFFIILLPVLWGILKKRLPRLIGFMMAAIYLVYIVTAVISPA